MKLFPLLLIALMLMSGKCKDAREQADQADTKETEEHLATETVQQAQPPTNDEFMQTAKTLLNKVAVDSPSASVIYPTARSLYAMLERTPCFGRCPMYKLHLFEEGIAVYQVRRFVEGREPGFYKAVLEADVQEKIINKAKELGYFELNDQYPDKSVQVTDLPETITFVTTGDNEKMIKNKNYQTPPALREFEGFVDSLILKRDWTRVELSLEE